MASEIKANKISPATGTALQISDSGDTTTIPSGATLDVNGTADLSGATMTGFTIPSGQTVTIASGATIDATGATATGFGVAGTNAFAARITSELTITSNVNTKLTFDTEDFDSEGVFTSNTFTAPVAGKYFISTNMYCNANTASAVRHAQLFIKKNGSDFNRLNWSSGYYMTDQPIAMTILMDLALNDTVDVYVNVNRGGGNAYIDKGFFGGFRIQ